MKKNTDEHFMRQAIQLALRAKGQTSPNPLVGCVIVKAGKIVAEGWHKRAGGDHAELDALKKAGHKARGAVMYVTLEPCSHWGRTPPCVDAVVAAGIRKVVVAMIDPNPINQGKSLQILRRKGIKVELGLCEKEARALNPEFIKWITRRLPYTTAKIAQTVDGKTATHAGQSKWITSASTRLWARRKRSEFDAILVGINTIIVDNPSLEAEGKSLYKIVLDSSLKISPQAKIFQNTISGQVILVVSSRSPQIKRDAFLRRGIVVLVCPDTKGKIDLTSLFKQLAKKGIISILIEGGAQVIGSALKAGLVDRLHVYVAPKVLGDQDALSSVNGVRARTLAQAKQFSISTVERLGDDIFIEYLAT